METLVAILCYLSVILGPSTYTQCEWDAMLIDNADDIETVQNDPAAMQTVNSMTPPEITILADCDEEY